MIAQGLTKTWGKNLLTPLAKMIKHVHIRIVVIFRCISKVNKLNVVVVTMNHQARNIRPTLLAKIAHQRTARGVRQNVHHFQPRLRVGRETKVFCHDFFGIQSRPGCRILEVWPQVLRNCRLKALKISVITLHELTDWFLKRSGLVY